jgi:CheY-like chemotaxis protein/HPt (histidine-containing phosphotransfer) domain-containing protein
VVDDNASNRLVLDELLRHWEMKPALADSGAEGISLLEQAAEAGKPIPLILLDCHMPEMDGFAFAARIKTDGHFHGAIIMLLTSGDQRGDAVRCHELHIGAFLVKPILEAELQAAILTALGHGAEASNQQATLVTRGTHRSSARGLHILLAEDNRVNQVLAVRILQKSEHSVTAVSNGREVLAKLEAGDFQLILMDVQMPEMDGLETTRAIRAKEAATGRHVPIIALTAYAMKGDRERCLAAGMDGYVAKPIQPGELSEAIEQLVRHPDTPLPASSQTKEARGVELVCHPDTLPPAPEDDCVDWQAALSSLDGDRQLFRDLADSFLQSLPSQMEAIHQAAQKCNIRDIERAAHRLKGSVGSFSAKPAYEAAFRLEKIARHGDIQQVPEARRILDSEIERLKHALERWLSGQAGTSPPTAPPPAPGIPPSSLDAELG